MATVYPGIPDALRVLSASARCFVVTSKRKDFAARIVASLAFAAAISAASTAPSRTAAWTTRRDLIAAVLRIEALDPQRHASWSVIARTT